jgi:hypothetical protein
VKILQQAYSKAPWRTQMQFVGTVMLVIISVWIVAGIYLNVTTRAATLGREIQAMQVRFYGLQDFEKETDDGAGGVSEALPIEELQQKIVSLEAELAYLTSYQTMMKRAEVIGFRQANSDSMLYLEVPGYTKPSTANLAPASDVKIMSAAGLPPEFKQSLVDWLADQVKIISMFVKEARP